MFLDELPESGRHVLGVQRQPLVEKVVTISEAKGSLSFPANSLPVVAMDPCP
jgi:magnesium chelatase family protein